MTGFVVGGHYPTVLNRHVFESLASHAPARPARPGAGRARPAPRHRGAVQGGGPGAARRGRAGRAGHRHPVDQGHAIAAAVERTRRPTASGRRGHADSCRAEPRPPACCSPTGVCRDRDHDPGARPDRAGRPQRPDAARATQLGRARAGVARRRRSAFAVIGRFWISHQHESRLRIRRVDMPLMWLEPAAASRRSCSCRSRTRPAGRVTADRPVRRCIAYSAARVAAVALANLRDLAATPRAVSWSTDQVPDARPRRQDRRAASWWRWRSCRRSCSRRSLGSPALLATCSARCPVDRRAGPPLRRPTAAVADARRTVLARTAILDACRGSSCWTTAPATCGPPNARCAGSAPTSRSPPTATPPLDADGLVVPGVGAFAACMAGLPRSRGPEIIERRLAGGRPVLGICVGMQVLFDLRRGARRAHRGLRPVAGHRRAAEGRRPAAHGLEHRAAAPGSMLFAGLDARHPVLLRALLRASGAGSWSRRRCCARRW